MLDLSSCHTKCRNLPPQEVAVKAARRDADELLVTIKERVLQEGKLFWLLKHQVRRDMGGSGGDRRLTELSFYCHP